MLTNGSVFRHSREVRAVYAELHGITLFSCLLHLDSRLVVDGRWLPLFLGRLSEIARDLLFLKFWIPEARAVAI